MTPPPPPPRRAAAVICPSATNPRAWAALTANASHRRRPVAEGAGELGGHFAPFVIRGCSPHNKLGVADSVIRRITDSASDDLRPSRLLAASWGSWELGCVRDAPWESARPTSSHNQVVSLSTAKTSHDSDQASVSHKYPLIFVCTYPAPTVACKRMKPNRGSKVVSSYLCKERNHLTLGRERSKEKERKKINTTTTSSKKAVMTAKVGRIHSLRNRNQNTRA